jgi:hypothetical protein
MKSFIVKFANEQQWAEHQIEATSPEAALKEARRMATDEPHRLDYQPYEEFWPISEIQVFDDDENVVAYWYDDGLRLLMAAPDLLTAAEKVVARWKRGDLAEAVRELAVAIAKANEGAR